MNKNKLMCLIICLLGTCASLIGQSYYLFNDSTLNKWNVKILSYEEGNGINRLLLSYQNSLDNTLYPAIGELKNGKIKITEILNNGSFVNFSKPVLKTDNSLVLPTTVIQNQRYFYDLKELDKYGTSNNHINFIVYPYQILAGGIYPLTYGTYLELSTIQKEPDNPGQAAFYNAWFETFVFVKKDDFQFKKEVVPDKRIKSPFNEEVISGCKGNDTMFYILVRRYTKKDFSEYEGVLYAVSLKGQILWSDKIPWDDKNELSIFSYNKGVMLSVASKNDNFILPNTTYLVYYDLKGKTDKSVIIEKFFGNCGIETSSNEILLGGAEYKVDSAFRMVVKKSKTVLLDKDLNIKNFDVLDFFEGPDLEITMMQFSTSHEITSITEKKDKSFLMTGSAYRPVGIAYNAERLFYGMILYGNKVGKIDR